MNKRLLKELRNLYVQQSQKSLIDNDYIIYFDENNINKIHALIKPPSDSLYVHKFIRLDLIIPENYPHSPPEVCFINHDSVRIHPNMYENGKCCATILNTWGNDKYEKWTSSMGIETILLTFHSFLDNHPYTYEPGGGDDPSYSVYVLYQSWITCLIKYLQYETIPLFIDAIKSYLLYNLDSIFQKLRELRQEYPTGYYSTNCFEIDEYYLDYNYISALLEKYINQLEFDNTDELFNITDLDSVNTECNYKCNICFDTTQSEELLKLYCSHQFHKTCLNNHISLNENLCPMCRTELQNNDLHMLNGDEKWMINPLTKRKIKIGGKTWLYLKDYGHI